MSTQTITTVQYKSVTADMDNIRHAIEACIINSDDLNNLPTLPHLKKDTDFRLWELGSAWFSDAQLESAYHTAKRRVEELEQIINELVNSPYDTSYNHDVDDFEESAELSALRDNLSQLTKLESYLLIATI